MSNYPVFYKYTVYENIPTVFADVAIERLFSPWNKRSQSFEEFFDFSIKSYLNQQILKIAIIYWSKIVLKN